MSRKAPKKQSAKDYGNFDRLKLYAYRVEHDRYGNPRQPKSNGMKDAKMTSDAPIEQPKYDPVQDDGNELYRFFAYRVRYDQFGFNRSNPSALMMPCEIARVKPMVDAIISRMMKLAG